MTQTLGDAGDTGTVEAGGGIETDGVSAVEMNNDTQTVRNSGDISTNNGIAIFLVGADGTIVNDGSIATTGTDSVAIGTFGLRDQITNNGTITTSGSNATGISSESANSTVVNNGAIRTEDDLSTGIFASRENTSVTNNGTVATIGMDAGGLSASGDTATLINNGTITTQGASSSGLIGSATGIELINNGNVTTVGDDAVGMISSGSGSSFVNSGSIETTGAAAFGIAANGENSTIANSGSISTTGFLANGIVSDSDGTTIVTSGSIMTTGETAEAVSMLGANASLTNSGSIATFGEESFGTRLSGDDSSFTNSGSVATTGDWAHGVHVEGFAARIGNSGSITTTGAEAHGISVENEFATISNSGRIVASGSGAHAIFVSGDNANVSNSGTVISRTGSSFQLEGSDAVLSLMEGSVLEGVISFDDADSATLAYSAGQTAVLRFSDLPGSLQTGGLPHWTDGSVIGFVNPTDFRLDTVDEVLNSLTGGIADTLGEHLETSRTEGQASGLIATHGTAAQPDDLTLWASSIGSVLQRDGSSGFVHAFGGVLAGIDTRLSSNGRAGLFAGASFGRTESNDDSYGSDATGVFAGAYWTAQFDAAFAELSGTIGYLGRNDDVTILNNSVTGGLQDVSLSYDSVFVSPTLTLGRILAVQGGSTLTPSARLRYSGLFQLNDAYDTTTRFGVSDQALHVIELRGQLAYGLKAIEFENASLHLDLTTGVDGIFTAANTADTSLNGAAINLSLDDDPVVRGFAKAGARLLTSAHSEFTATLESGYDSSNTVSGSARLGYLHRF
ncbi:autotransporter family protein [Roseibium sp. M-1]